MQSIGETLRPLWGLMDKCYPVATQVGEAGALLPEGAAVLGALSWVDSLRGLVGGLVVGAGLPARMAVSLCRDAESGVGRSKPPR